MLKFCRRFLTWGVVIAAAITVVAVPYFYGRVDNEIRTRVEALLGSKYPQLQISIRSAKLVRGEGVELRGVSFHERSARGPQAELLHVEELFAFCSTDVADIVRNGIDIQGFAVRRPTLRATRRPDGTWSCAKLLPLPKFGDRPPRATIEDGIIELFDPTCNPSATLTLRGASLKMTPTPPTDPASAAAGTIRVEGTCLCDHARQIVLEANLDPTGKSFSMSGTIDDLRLGPDLCHALPARPAAGIKPFEQFRGSAQARFRVSYRADAQPAFDYDVEGQVSQARIDDARLPYPLEDLKARYHCGVNGWKVFDATARSGQTSVALAAEGQGYTPERPITIRAQLRRLALDGRLSAVLPPSCQPAWQKFLPSGEVDVDAQLAFDGRQWTPDLTIRCLDVGFTYQRFPYRLVGGRGTVRMKNRTIASEITCLADRAPVRIVSQYELVEPLPIGWVEVRGEGIRVDDRLLGAMPGRSAVVLPTLRPTGAIDVFYRSWHERAATSGQQPRLRQQAEVTVCRGAVNYEKFPYPISDITGKLDMQDGVWTLRDLQGQNATARILCQGQIITQASTAEYALRFIGTNVALNEELRNAQKPAVQQFWTDMKPRGTVNMETDLHFRPGDVEPRVRVRVTPVEDTVSVEPAHFPYRLDKLRGEFVFADGRATLDRVRTEHGPVVLAGRGYCDLNRDGGWTLHFDHLDIDRLRADRDLVQALPGRLRKIVSDLRVEGPVNVRGSFELASRGIPGEPLTAGWNVRFDTQETSLTVGMRLDHINGSVSMQGSFDGQQFRSQGEVKVDSLMFRDVQFTEVMGPFWLDDGQLLVGFWADRLRQAQPERRLTARLYGGTLVSDGWVNFGQPSRYNFQSTLSAASLARVTQEAIPGRQPMTGEVAATVELHGKGSSLNDLGGRGTVQLRNADIYQLPAMVSLLKLLSIRQPDTTAFTKSDIDFYIQAEHLYFDRIDFSGDVISLLGKGEMNFNRQVRLTFHAMVGPNERRMPVLREVLGGASQQIMLIHADGPISSPSLRREAFPGVNLALQQLQAEFQSREDTARRPPQPSPALGTPAAGR